MQPVWHVQKSKGNFYKEGCPSEKSWPCGMHVTERAERKESMVHFDLAVNYS